MSFDFELQVTEETEGTRFNTGISAMMEFINAAYKVFSCESFRTGLVTIFILAQSGQKFV